VKAPRFYEYNHASELVESTEKVYNLRDGDEVRDYLILWNRGDETINKWRVQAEIWPNLWDAETEEEPWASYTTIISDGLEFKINGYWTDTVSDYDVGPLKPNEWVRIPYRFSVYGPGRFYFLIRCLVDVDTGPKWPFRYKATFEFPYYEIPIHSDNRVFKFTLPHPPMFARWDYEDLGIDASGSPRRISDIAFVPYVWINRGSSWELKAYATIPGGDVYGTSRVTLYCGAKLPFWTRRLMNPQWLKDQSVNAERTLSSWELNDQGDHVVLRGDVR